MTTPDPTPIPLCVGCTHAEARTLEFHAAGRTSARAVHHCYRTNYAKPCGCESCHPDGSFMLAGNATIAIDLVVDLAALIRDDVDGYRSTTLTGHEEWERPMVFLWGYLEEDSGSVSFGWRVDERHGEFEFEETASWSPERFAELCKVCPEARIDAEVAA